MKLHYLTIPLAAVLAASLVSSCGTTNQSTATQSSAVDGAITPVVNADDSTARVAQLSLAEGEISLRPETTEDWKQASINEPVLEGSELYAGEGSSGEVVLGDQRYLRFGDGADVEFTQLDPGLVQLGLTAGTATLALDALEPSERFEVNTPDGAIVPSGAGEYRIDIDDNGDTWLSVRKGTAHVLTPNGSFDVNEGESVNLGSTEAAPVEVANYGDLGSRDDWDSWNDDRRVYYTNLANEDRPEPVNDLYGRSDIFGLATLAAAGIWRALDNDRYGWYPRVGSGWSPYENGYWDYSPAVGYTWISNDNWGWAPYHYGRWDYNSNGWFWSPSDGLTTIGYSTWRNPYRWQPALVYVVQPPQSNNLVWVPLAYGEPYVAYTQPWSVTVAQQQQVAFVPRFFRERRGLVYVPVNDLDRRVRARRADRVVLDRIDRFDVAKAGPVVMPRPGRVVPVDRVARVRPPSKVRDRVVVVDPDGRVAKRQERTALTPRQVRKAETRRVDTRRVATDPTRIDAVPRVTRKGGGMRADRNPETRKRAAERGKGTVAAPAPSIERARPAPPLKAEPHQRPNQQRQRKAVQPAPKPARQRTARPAPQPTRQMTPATAPKPARQKAARPSPKPAQPAMTAPRSRPTQTAQPKARTGGGAKARKRP